jgi:3,5-epimerase/4-reductase
MMIKFLVYGHKGWIGSMLCQIMEQQNIPFVKATSRANNRHDVEQEIKQVVPSHIFSCIGRTHGTTTNGKSYSTIDYLEEKETLPENIRDNLYSPLVLALLSSKYNIHFSYLGTGCIFEYDTLHELNSKGFSETDSPNFFGSSYSIVKGFTDQLFHLLEKNCLNLRIRMPITDQIHVRNFITKITTYDRICSIANSMSVLDELLPIAVDMAKNKVTGTVNLTNPGTITHNEILTMYQSIINPEFTWKNFTIEEQASILQSGRSNNYLETSRLENLYPTVNPIHKSVENALHRMKNRFI